MLKSLAKAWTFRFALWLLPALATSQLAPASAVEPATKEATLQTAAAEEKAKSTKGVQEFLETRVKQIPDDNIALNRLGGIYLGLLRETGLLSYLDLARKTAKASLASVPAEFNKGALVLQTRVELNSHQFAAARDHARLLVNLAADQAQSYQLLGDALVELGEYDEAAAAYRDMETSEPVSVATQSRLSKLALLHGDTALALKDLNIALQAAQTEASHSDAAWCLVQIGQIEFSQGDWNHAEKHYSEALEAVPQSFLAQEHLAELRAAQRKYDEAVKLYLEIVARVPRPEFQQALGDVYASMGKQDEAAQWLGKARDAYLKSVAEGNDYFDHHLAGFYSDSQQNPDEALKWARKDIAMRKSVYAWDSLAWALYRSGKFTEALEASQKSLATGTCDAHLLFHAGMIALSAGDLPRGKELLKKTAEANPRYNSFHVHR